VSFAHKDGEREIIPALKHIIREEDGELKHIIREEDGEREIIHRNYLCQGFLALADFE